MPGARSGADPEGRLMRVVALAYKQASENTDKVWGGVVQMRPATRVSTSTEGFRFVAFWGRRARSLNLRPYAWTSYDTAVSHMEKKLAEKMTEGYLTVNWRDAYYGMNSVVRELADGWDTEPQPLAELVPQPEASVPTPPASPSPFARRRREIKLE